MARKLTPEEKKFIEDFESMSRNEPSLAAKTKELQQAKKHHRSLVVFIVWLAFLAISPFVLSGVFLYQMAQFNTLFQDEVIGGLLEEGKAFEEIVMGSPLEGMGAVYELYENRVVIVGGIFTVFIVLIGISLIARLLLTSYRKKK